MTSAEHAVKLLIGQAREATGEGRYSAALAAAGRAVEAAEQLDDPVLRVRGLIEEAEALRLSGDRVAALTRYTKVLGLAEDPATRDHPDHLAATRARFDASILWVECARFVGGIEVRELFGALNAAESWLATIGHRDWRAGILLQRAYLHQQLGELDAAVAATQEGLAVYQPDGPGYTLASYRCKLGDLLHQSGRADEAEPVYQAVLDHSSTGQNDREMALQGLAWCALAAQDPETGQRHAAAAVQLADTLGDERLRTALQTLVAACRDSGDLDTAWQAATRCLDICRRLGGHHVLYDATRDALDVAVDRRDQGTVDQLLTELESHATALDTDTGSTIFADEVTRRRRSVELLIGKAPAGESPHSAVHAAERLDDRILPLRERVDSKNLSRAEHGYQDKSNRRRQKMRKWRAGLTPVVPALVRLVLVLVLVVVMLNSWSVGQHRAEIAADDLATESARLRPFDSYGSMQLALRAYRTDPNVPFGVRQPHAYPGVDRLLPDYTMARDLAREDLAESLAMSGAESRMKQLSQVANMPSKKVSASGDRIVTTDSAGRVVLWSVAGDRILATSLSYLFNPWDMASRVTISRSGRYLAFIQHMFPLPHPDLNGPVDEDGLPKVDPDDYPTCKPANVLGPGKSSQLYLASFVTCLVVYDIDRLRVSSAVPLGELTFFVADLSIDPDDEVVTAVLPGSGFRSLVESSDNTLRRWDLRTGKLRDQLRIPWRSWIVGLWLGPGGRTAIVQELMPRRDGMVAPDRLALSAADLGVSPGRQEIADSIDTSAMSLDWHTLAALRSTSDGAKEAVVWDVRSLAVTRIPGLSKEEGRGSIALTRNGSTLVIPWTRNPSTGTSADIRQLGTFQRTLSTWSLPDARKQTAQESYDQTWETLVPLGDEVNGPVALLNSSTIGLSLPRHRQLTPLRRLADEGQRPMPIGDVMTRLCTLMADPDTDTSVRGLVPKDANEEKLCSS